MKHFINIDDFTKDEINAILTLSKQLKTKKTVTSTVMANKRLGMFFEKPSTRTRVSFEVGAYQLGGQAIALKESEVGLGKREPVKDVARVMSRFVDIMMLRTFSHETVEDFAKYASIPIINGLTDKSHPCQAMADILTITENFSKLEGLNMTYIGDGNNVCYSLVKIGQKMGLNCTVSCPEGYDPEVDVKIERDPQKAVEGAHIVYTDTWFSMGDEVSTEKEAQFKPYQVNRDLMTKAAQNAIFMHCLPAHRGEEVTDEVMESKQSVIFDQAENRLHAQKGVMAYLLEENEK